MFDFLKIQDFVPVLGKELKTFTNSNIRYNLLKISYDYFFNYKKNDDVYGA